MTATYGRIAALAIEEDAYDQIWAQAEADGSDTLEWKVPSVLSYDADGFVLRARKSRGDVVTHPLTGIPYKVRLIDQQMDGSGAPFYHYLAQAPHYDLGTIAAIPFNTETGTTIDAVFRCVEQIAAGWTFSGSGCASWAGDSRCPEQPGPQLQSQKSSVLTMLFQISQTWGGRWRFDEAAKHGYLECNIGTSSGMVAHWQRNMASVKRTEQDKPLAEILVMQSPSGVLTGVTAQMAIAELLAADACDAYLEQVAQQLQSAAGTPDPCSLGANPGSLLNVYTKSNAVSSERAYLYEQFILAQGPSISYETTVIDLSAFQLGAPGPAELGQSIRVVHDELGIDDTVRVVQRSLNILEPEKTTYQLSTEVPWMAIALQPPPYKPPPGTGSGGPSTPPNAPKQGPKNGDNGAPCVEDPRGIIAEWIPPPVCVGQGEKLKIALQDRQAQLAALIALASSMGVDNGKLSAAVSGFSGIPLRNDTTGGGGGFFDAGPLFAALGEVGCRLAQAILEAELQVIEAEAQVTNADVIIAAAPVVQRAIMTCDMKVQKQGMDAAKGAKAAVDRTEQGHWEYSLRQAASNSQPGCPQGCTDPSAPTNLTDPNAPTAAGGAIASAVTNAVGAVCVFTQTTLPLIASHQHQDCGDITVDYNPPSGGGGGGGAGDNNPKVDQLAEETAARAKALYDANQLLQQQIQQIHDTDAAVKKLHDNTKECVNQWQLATVLMFAGCGATTGDSKPSPANSDVGTGVGGDVTAWLGSKTGDTPAALRRGSGALRRLDFPSGDDDGIPNATSLATAVSYVARQAQNVLPGLAAGASKIFDLHEAGVLALQADIVVEAAPPSSAQTYNCAPPDFHPKKEEVLDSVNVARETLSQMATAADDVLQDLGQLSPVLDAVRHPNSRNTNANEPHDSGIIDDARTLLRDSADPLRVKLGGDFSKVTALALVCLSDVDTVVDNVQGVLDAAIEWMQAVGNYRPPKMDPVYDALGIWVDYPAIAVQTGKLKRALRELTTQLREYVRDLRSACHGVDSYVVTTGRDLNHQWTRNEGMQASWIAGTQNVHDNFFEGFQHDRIFGGGNGVQRLNVGTDPPEGPHNVDDLWVKPL